ncbi:hypothetical protein PoB_006826700 [Plakobranchus ocellatus]|uniref:CCHC-type domain-containing protein n=1 Tax=Plakobranchus ocellatus TaxID=259542 RepID=A0AAV4DBY0_9GAST|nr:hypothetical protein PoB_006826700 [Plakobranchus ocellatus]
MVALKTVASAYMDARPNKSFRRKLSISFAPKSEPYRSTVRVAEKRDGRSVWSGPHGGGGRIDYSSRGHRSPSFQGGSNVIKRGASRSPSRDRNNSNVASKNIGQGHFRPSSRSGSSLASSHSNVTCFQCGGREHVRRECPSRPREANFASSVPDSPSHSRECPSRPKEANFAFSVPELPYHCCAAKMDCIGVALTLLLLVITWLEFTTHDLAGHFEFPFEFPYSSLSTIEPSLSIDNVLDEKLNPIHDSGLKFYDTICFAEPTAYVSAISEEDDGEICSLVATPPLASESGTVVIDPSLSASQVQDIKALLLEFQDILTSAPRCTNTLCHEIRLTTDDVIRVKPYPLPFAARDFVTQEVNDLLS